MHGIFLQAERLDAGRVGANENVVFDSIVISAGNIDYDRTPGVVTLLEPGKYEFIWWAATQSSNSMSGTGFVLVTSQGASVIGNSPVKTGQAYAANWNTSGGDYAEMFETMDGNPIEPGYFITLGPGKKIKKATDPDGYILGISSAVSGVVGDVGELHWKDKYITDEWGAIQYREVEVPEMKSEDGTVLQPGRIETQPMLNPAWDPKREYIPRAKRPEWVIVGLLGKLLIRDDGTCVPGGYCAPNAQGVATTAASGYRVLERTGKNQVRIIVK